MKKVLVVMLALTALHAAARVAFGQCGPAGCAPRQLAAAVYSQSPLTWHRLEGGTSLVGLYSGNTLIGSYSFDDGFYRRWTGFGWSGPARSPITPPFGGLAGNQAGHVFGASHDQVSKQQAFSFNGQPVTREAAENIITGNLRDDSAAGYLTNVDTDKERRKRFDADLADLRRSDPKLQNVRANNYDPNLGPNRVILAPFRLETDRQFSQSGRAMFAQPAPRDGAGSSKAERWYGDIGRDHIVEAVRVIDPTYDPNKSPLPSMPAIGGDVGQLVGAAGLGVLMLAAFGIARKTS